MTDPHAFTLYILILGFMWLLLKTSNPMSWQCPDCGGMTNSHFPSCPRTKKKKVRYR